MSRKHFSWLLVLTVLAAIAIALVPERTGRESGHEVEVLFPGLADRINDIDEVRVARGGDEAVATLRREGSGWTVAETGGYPADWDKLRGLLAGLAQARVLEPKTANPEYFERLGLRDVSDPDSAALRVQIGADDDAPAVLVGNAAQNRDGQYVRLVGGDRAYLIDRSLDVAAETRDWLDRQIVDIGEDEVVDVEITHADGAAVRLRKTSADDADFTLLDIPEGREAQSSWTVNAPAGGLSGLRLDEVRPAADVSLETPVRFVVLTADGLRVEAELGEFDSKHWIRVNASEAKDPLSGSGTSAVGEMPVAEETEAEGGDEGETGSSGAAAAGADEAPSATESDAPGHSEAATDQTTGNRAAEINARVAGWAYAIPQYKFDVLTRTLDDLLEPESEPEPDFGQADKESGD